MSEYLENMETLKIQLGDLLLAWGNLELALAGISSQLICGSDNRIPIFYTIVSNHARGLFLENCILTSQLDESDANNLLKIKKRFVRLNVSRNKYVHSVYGPFSVKTENIDADGIYISNLTSKPKQSEDFVVKLTPLNASEIKNHIDAVYKLGLDSLKLSDKLFGTDHLIEKAE